ncbi:MAG TPA: hypothetical protein VMY37_31545 [Thermoguttaceae bacterium]|nr:hypothetical protein [Thermoguttaceae bacterium]
MADNSEPTRRTPASAAIWPGVFAVMAAVFACLAYKPPLETARPEVLSPSGLGPRTVSDVGAVHARLWQDPLEAAYQDFGRRAEAVAKGYVPPPPLGEIQPGRFRKIVQDSLDFRGGNGKLLFVPVLLPGGPYAEDKETRMRIRYAVLAALGTCHYRLSLGTRMSYMNVPVKTYYGVLGDKKLRYLGDQIDEPLTIPVKIYRPDLVRRRGHDKQKPFGGVLICWLDQGQLGDRPLSVILQLYQRLFPESDRDRKDERDENVIGVAVLGPTGSDALNGMLLEDRNWAEAGFNFGLFPEGTKVFSPRATVWPDVVDVPKESLGPEGAFALRRCNAQLVRTIGTDYDLFAALRQELALRGAWPKREKSSNHIVVITERDTLYGRAIPAIFRREGVPAANLHVFEYLRGLDGAIPAEKTQKDRANGNRTAAARGRSEPAEEEATEGRAQLDYLRRLERQLVRLDEDLRRLDGGRIKAIGVLGTDFYDKLLVLRALRKRFSRVRFFTTDLDAGFNHQEEIDYTRNLLVASHFGLGLHRDLQRDVPPFRDSYQTSVFFATLLALEDPEAGEALSGVKRSDPWDLEKTHPRNSDPKMYLEPLVFEIGRRSAYQLTKTGGDSESEPTSEESDDGSETSVSVSAKVHPASPREHPWLSSGWRPFYLLGALAGIMICLALLNASAQKVVSALWAAIRGSLVEVLWLAQLHRSAWLEDVARRGLETGGSPWLWKSLDFVAAKWNALACRIERERKARERFAVGLFFAAAALVALIVFDHFRVKGEPFSVLEGISIWPSTLLRLLAVVLAIFYFYKGWRDLERNHTDICRELFGFPKEDESAGPSEPAKSEYRQFWTKLSDLELISPYLRGGLAPWSRTLIGRSHLLKWPADAERMSIKTLYRQYFRRGRLSQRRLRVGALTAFYLAFGLSLFRMTNLPNMPSRGDLSAMVGWGVLFAAVVLMITLVFFVLDATELCRRFVRKLAKETYGWPSRGMAQISGARGSVDRESLRELLAIRLIAHRTNVVEKLMYGPCMVILFVVLSRHRVFDYWDWPWPLILLIALNLSAAVYCAFSLRNRAQKARRDVLERLDGQLAHAVGTGEARRAEQIRQIIREVTEENRGAFSPWAKNPILGALALPAIGGVGGLLFIERFLSLLP